MRVPGCGGGGSGGCGTGFSPSSWVAKAGKSLESEDSLVYRGEFQDGLGYTEKLFSRKQKNKGGGQGMKMSVGVVV